MPWPRRSGQPPLRTRPLSLRASRQRSHSRPQTLHAFVPASGASNSHAIIDDVHWGRGDSTTLQLLEASGERLLTSAFPKRVREKPRQTSEMARQTRNAKYNIGSVAIRSSLLILAPRSVATSGFVTVRTRERRCKMFRNCTPFSGFDRAANRLM